MEENDDSPEDENEQGEKELTLHRTLETAKTVCEISVMVAKLVRM